MHSPATRPPEIFLKHALKAQPDGVDLAVRLQPRSSKNEIAGVMGNELKIKVTAPPVDNAANQALIEFLAHRLNFGRSAIQIMRGHTSRHKVVRITGLTPEAISNRLLPA